MLVSKGARLLLIRDVLPVSEIRDTHTWQECERELTRCAWRRYTPEQPWLLTWAHTMDSELLDQGWATLPSLGPGTPWARRQRSPTRCGDDVVGDVWRQGAAPGFFASSSYRQVCRQQQSSEEALLRAVTFARQNRSVFVISTRDLACNQSFEATSAVCGPNVLPTHIVAYIDSDHLNHAGSTFLWPYLCSAFERFGFFRADAGFFTNDHDQQPEVNDERVFIY